MNNYYSNGKLLLTGEYLVLDGATALAIPTKKGQSLAVSKLDEPKIRWKSILHDKNIWMEVEFDFEHHSLALPNKNPTTEVNRLFEIFKTLYSMNDSVFKSAKGWAFTSFLDFPKNWGLGSSSTLLNNVAQWANVNPYELLQKTFGGSGYDIASAKHNYPIYFTLKNGMPNIERVDFDPVFKDSLFFVHLNQKKSSQEAIKHYQALPRKNRDHAIHQLTGLTKRFAVCHTLSDFNEIIVEHETILSTLLNLTTIKERLFDDYAYGSIKSLGGWGGDFVLATGTQAARAYFRSRGYRTVVEYKEMVL